MKHFIVLLILIAVTFSFKAQAQNSDQINLNDYESQQLDQDKNSLKSLIQGREEYGKIAPDSPSIFGRVFGGNETLTIPQIDEEIGVQLDTYSTEQDTAKGSFGLMMSSNLKDAAGLTTFEFTYSQKYKKVWLEGYISQTSAKTKRLTDYNSNIATPTSDLLEESSDITQFGFGAMYRTTYIQNIIPSSRFFETTSALATYNQFEDVVSEQSYSGFGVKADLGLHYRLSPQWHIGGKFSYNLSTVKREAEFEEEKPNDRSLLLRWVSVGAELSIYF
jgi:hypothetical protein